MNSLNQKYYIHAYFFLEALQHLWVEKGLSMRIPRSSAGIVENLLNGKVNFLKVETKYTVSSTSTTTKRYMHMVYIQLPTPFSRLKNYFFIQHYS